MAGGTDRTVPCPSSTGSSDPYCIVKIDDEAIIRWVAQLPGWSLELLEPQTLLLAGVSICCGHIIVMIIVKIIIYYYLSFIIILCFGLRCSCRHSSV